jgi:hypothetical protein
MRVIPGLFTLCGACILAALGWHWRRSPECLDPDGLVARNVYVRVHAFRGDREDSGHLTTREIRCCATIVLVSAAMLAGAGITQIALALQEPPF